MDQIERDLTQWTDDQITKVIRDATMRFVAVGRPQDAPSAILHSMLANLAYCLAPTSMTEETFAQIAGDTLRLTRKSLAKEIAAFKEATNPLGECGSCYARNMPLRQVWVTGMETWACPKCRGEKTVECELCGVDVQTDALGKPGRCLDPKCPLEPREQPC